MSNGGQWRRCNACKGPIERGAVYWTCNVSTCNQKRTGLAFCSVSCWEVHLPAARHRKAWAVERRAPLQVEEPPNAVGGARPEKRKRIVATVPSARGASADPQEILIVASRLKDFIRARSGFNTSERVLEPLSDVVRRVCLEAIENARREGRRTVLERDIVDR